ncbi:MAG: ester cyclase, partial [Methyloceanibacter sp.]|nr:ester cyclase [Methyloceanibacter sp.]
MNDKERETAKAYGAMVRRRFRELDKKNFAILDELFDPAYVLHFAGMPTPMKLATTRQFYEMLYTAFPDLKHTIEEQVCAGNKVVTRWTAQGTHHGDWMGIAATRKPISLTGINIYTVRRGKLSQSHVNWARSPRGPPRRSGRMASVG